MLFLILTWERSLYRFEFVVLSVLGARVLISGSCPCNVGLCFTTVTWTVTIAPTNRSSTQTGSMFSLLTKYAVSYFEYLHRIDLNRELQQQVIDFGTNFEVLNLVLDT